MRTERAGLPSPRLLYLLCAGVAIAYGVWTLRTGVRVSADSTTYSRWADVLIAHQFNISSYLQDQSFIVPPILYVLWIAVVAALKVLLGSSWMTGVVTLNWLSLVAGAYATLATIRRLTASAAGMLLAAALFLAATDLLIFVPFVLSDLLFWGVSTVVLATGLRLATADADHSRRELAAAALTGSLLVVIAIAFRPAAVPLVAFWAGAMIAWWGRALVDRFAVALFAGLSVLAFIAIAWHAYLMMHPSSVAVRPAARVTGAAVAGVSRGGTRLRTRVELPGGTGNHLAGRDPAHAAEADVRDHAVVAALQLGPHVDEPGVLRPGLQSLDGGASEFPPAGAAATARDVAAGAVSPLPPGVPRAVAD